MSEPRKKAVNGPCPGDRKKPGARNDVPRARLSVQRQPPQVLQLPLQCALFFPVAENISPLQSRSARFPQAGQGTGSSNFCTSSSNFCPHCGHLYCKIGIVTPPFFRLPCMLCTSSSNFCPHCGHLYCKIGIVTPPFFRLPCMRRRPHRRVCPVRLSRLFFLPEQNPVWRLPAAESARSAHAARNAARRRARPPCCR